jgi:hypothetical protein
MPAGGARQADIDCPKEGAMAELSADEVREVIGPLSDVVVAEIIATGITKNQLAAAFARVKRDRTSHDPGPTLSPGPFAKVVDLLERLNNEGLLGEAGSQLQ